MDFVCYLLSFFCLHFTPSQPPDAWIERILNNEIIYASTNAPNGYYPNIGNGFIGCNVGCYPNVTDSEMHDINSQLGRTPHGSLYMAGVYNGNLSGYKGNGNYKYTSHRAQIPGINSFYIKTFQTGYNISWLGAAIDLSNGTVYNQSRIYHPILCPKPVDVQITQYTHRYLRSLLVFNISLMGINQNEDIYCAVPLANCNLHPTLDFKWSDKIIQNPKYQDKIT